MNGRLKNSLWAVAFLMIILAWIFGLFIDLTGDSGLYAAISRQMVESGDWLNLKINGEPYDQKPHLFFWLAGLGIQLFGNTNFAFKLFPFLFGLSSLYSIYRLARLFFSELAGKLAALITGTSQIFFLYFLDLHTDSVLQAAVALALWQLAEYLNSKKPLNFILGFLGIGLAMLTKGPVGAILPFFFVLFFLLLNKDYRQLFHPKWLLGIILVLVIISPSLYHLGKSFGFEGIRFYFIDNNIGRVTGKVAGSSTDPFFYLYNLLWAFLPWTVLVLAALFWEIKSWFGKQSVHKFASSLLGSILVLLFVYSIARGKAPNYLMILIGPLIIIASGKMQHYSQLSSSAFIKLTLAQVVIWVLLVGLLLAVGFLFHEISWFTFILFLLTGIVILFLYLKIEKDNWCRLIYSGVIISTMLNLYLNAVVIPKLFSYQGNRQALDLFESDNSQQNRLYNYALEEYELFFNAKDSVRNIATWKQLYEAMEKTGTWIYTNEIKCNEILNMGFQIDTVYQIKHRGMNHISWQFVNPDTRNYSLEPNYLIKTKTGQNKIILK
ncbi:glycosyltransferase family 39 protein [Mariniphaga sediminis]|uniref:Glycosyltransferase family 39 protein n=1 Tax=Mariniphaga sediminis TaxID=1628158 RepID=A0A399D678_9BACT|nr:glycosyltransferase family 39 protein [Mariniphaga sediminis]RIH66883.1 glycosyltransferase family 39 protein [Mariniphaga sediminis]